MKRTAFLALILLACAHISCSSGAPAPSNSSAPVSPPPTEETNRLQRFQGEWLLGITYRSSPNIIINSSTTKVTQPTPNSISFKSSMQAGSGPYDMRMEEVVVTLRYEAAQKQYLLDAKLLNGEAIKDLPLTYSDASGYAGKGTATGSQGEMSAEVSIKNEAEKEHKWGITLSDKSRKEEYTFSFKNKGEEKQAGKP